MNNAKHTPGPWMFRHYEWGGEVSDDFGVFRDDGIGAGHEVAHAAKIYKGDRQPEVERANAALIAAAPDLLDALTKAEKFVNSHSEEWYLSGQELLAEVRAAIAKATNNK